MRSFHPMSLKTAGVGAAICVAWLPCGHFTLVVEDVSAGDPAAAKLRTDAIHGLYLPDVNAKIDALADFLLLGGGLPPKARFDGLHIACAAYHRANVALTWNFKHIANPVQMPVMRGLCDARGYRLPELASSLELMENGRCLFTRHLKTCRGMTLSCKSCKIFVRNW